MNWTSRKIWVYMIAWTLSYIAIAFFVQRMRSSRAIGISVMLFWMGDPPTAVWIIGIIMIVCMYLTPVSRMERIWLEVFLWTIIYVIGVYLFWFLHQAIRDALYILFGGAPSAIWVVGTLIIVYIKLGK